MRKIILTPAQIELKEKISGSIKKANPATILSEYATSEKKINQLKKDVTLLLMVIGKSQDEISESLGIGRITFRKRLKNHKLWKVEEIKKVLRLYLNT